MSSPRGLCDRDRCRAPVKRGKMTRAISLFFSPWPFRMSVVGVCEFVCQRERGRVWDGQRKHERGRGSPWGLINQACIELEGPGGSCVGRQVSIAFWGRGYGQTHQSSHSTHTHTRRHRQGWNYPETKPISSSCTSLPCHSPLLHIWFRFKCEILLWSNNESERQRELLL